MGVPVLPAVESIERLRTLKARRVSPSDRWGRKTAGWLVAWPLLFVALMAIRDTRPTSAEAAYNRAYSLYVRGDLIRTQAEAEHGFRRFLNSDPKYAAKFQALLARTLISRGMSHNALQVLAGNPSVFNDGETVIERLTIEGIANTYLPRFDIANQKLNEALSLCRNASHTACSGIPLARAVLALEEGTLPQARQLFIEALSVARANHDRRSEAVVLGNLCVTALQAEHYDEAIDWGNGAYRIAVDSGWEDRVESIAGNLAWAYGQVGDKEKALDLSLSAAQTAARLGNARFEIKWLANAGFIYQDREDLAHAEDVYRRSLRLATDFGSRPDIITSFEDLAFLSIDNGKLDDARRFLDEAKPLIHTSGERLDELEVMLADGQLAAALRQDRKAEMLFHTVAQDPASETAMRMSAEHQLARFYEVRGETSTAEKTYRIALATFEAARAELREETSKLPFLANATPIYDDYIGFLVKQGRTEEALAAADQSRARTLAQGLKLENNKASSRPAALHAVDVARRTGSTVLFYWLGEKQSYLWAITPKKSSLFTLPPQREITPAIERYRRALLQPALRRGTSDPDGAALYRMLVAPAAASIAAGSKVVVVCDGALSLLNFETLIVPGTSPAAGPHFWIEDASVVSAPSLYMLAAARPPAATGKKLLLMGDAVSPNPDYPELPMARAEMQQIGKHFPPGEETVFARAAANSGAYLGSPLRDYAYIHFVAHGMASRTDPLDSAIILSRTGTVEDSFKLHAREIIQHPIDARLVTISACYGGGTRSYAGEGLVGLSWAFLRAGAHNVIGALWEASDDSTPQLMDHLYAGLADGMSPGSALRQAKLSLLHSDGKFRQPFYWAPFQIYTGL